MSFVQLFDMYCSFMESNSLRHQDLVAPISAYAQAHDKPASEVLANIQRLYVRV